MSNTGLSTAGPNTRTHKEASGAISGNAEMYEDHSEQEDQLVVQRFGGPQESLVP